MGAVIAAAAAARANVEPALAISNTCTCRSQCTCVIHLVHGFGQQPPYYESLASLDGVRCDAVNC